MQLLKQSTAYTFQLGPFVDSTDGVTPEASLTIAATDVDLSKNGAAFADKNDATALTGTGDAQGYYDCVLNTTDTGTLGKLEVRCYVSGALPVWRQFHVVPANVYESLVEGSDNLEIDVQYWYGGAIPGVNQIGVPYVDAAYLAGVQQSLTDLKDFADAGYDPSTHKVAGVVLVDTTTTNTDMRGTNSALTTLGANAPAGWIDAAAVAAAALNGKGDWSTHSAANVVTAMGTGTFLSAIPWNAAWDTEVQSECADALAVYDPPTATEMTSAFTEIKGATWASGTDTLEGIRDRGDAAWLTATSVTVSDKTGFSLSATGLAAIGAWTVNLTGNLSGSVGSVAAGVTLADDAITAGKYDESTAFPVKSADAAATQIARVGADGDTLETLSDQIDGISVTAIWATALPGAYTSGQAGYILGTYLDAAISGVGGAVGSGANTVTITITAAGSPVAGVNVWIRDSGDSTTVAGTLTTDSNGQVAFQLDNGTYKAYKFLAGYNATNPQTLTVSGTTAQTYTMTAASASNEVSWTVDDLAAHLVGECNQDINADGTAPDRGARFCREAGLWVWHYTDWHWRKKKATLTATASTATASLASDFGEIDQKWLKRFRGDRLKFTMDPAVFQDYHDAVYDESGGAAGTGAPRLALIRQDTAEATFTYIVEFTPTPTETETFTYWYVSNDPWSLGTITDADSPTWPQIFHEAWRLESLWRWEKAFRSDDRWQDTKKEARAFLDQLMAENDEPTTLQVDANDDEYGDDSGTFLNPGGTGRWEDIP